MHLHAKSVISLLIMKCAKLVPIACKLILLTEIRAAYRLQTRLQCLKDRIGDGGLCDSTYSEGSHIRLELKGHSQALQAETAAHRQCRTLAKAA